MTNPIIGWCRLALLALSLSACAPIPVATNQPYGKQMKLRSVAHWKLLADQTVTAIPEILIAHRSMLYLKDGASRSPFDVAFESYLTSALVKDCAGMRAKDSTANCSISQGHPIPESEAHPNADTPQDIQNSEQHGASYVAYGVMRVDHRDSEIGRAPFGTFTLLGAGVWLGHQAAEHWAAGSRYVAGIPAGLALDLLSGSVPRPTHTEVIVSVAMVDADGNTIFRQDQNFYVDDADAAEYPVEPLSIPQGHPVVVNWQHIGIEP